MLVSDILKRVKRQFGDESGIQITDDDIIGWINDGIKEVSSAANLLETRAVADVVAGQSEYDMPDDVLTTFNVRYNGTNLRSLTLQEADHLIPSHDDPTVQANLGTPYCYWIWAQTIVLYPTPDTSGAANLRIYYTKLAPLVALAADSLPLPPQFDNAILAYAMKMAYELDEDWNAAAIKGREFTGSVSSQQEDTEFKTREAYPSITTADRDMGIEGTYYGY